PDEVLLANSTRSTLREAVDVERAGELENGDRPDLAWRLVDARAVAAIVPGRRDAPLVGREWELAQLRHAFDRAARGHTSYLITVLGPAGIGTARLRPNIRALVRGPAAVCTPRLAPEFATSVAGEAVVLTGRCPSYGAGVTYWPLAEIVR